MCGKKPVTLGGMPKREDGKFLNAIIKKCNNTTFKINGYVICIPCFINIKTALIIIDSF